MKSWLEALGHFENCRIPTLNIDAATKVLLAFIAGSPWHMQKTQSCADIAVEILNTPFLSARDDLKFLLQALRSSRTLAHSLKSWESLGKTLEERLSKDSDERLLRNLASVCKELRERLDQCSMDAKFLDEEHDRIAAIVKNASQSLLNASLQTVRALYDKVIKGMSNVIGPDRN